MFWVRVVEILGLGLPSHRNPKTRQLGALDLAEADNVIAHGTIVNETITTTKLITMTTANNQYPIANNQPCIPKLLG